VDVELPSWRESAEAYLELIAEGPVQSASSITGQH
jgi:hypothetical protein